MKIAKICSAMTALIIATVTPSLGAETGQDVQPQTRLVQVQLNETANLTTVVQNQTDQSIPQLKGGIATVTGVDKPDNCLRIRSGPGNSYDVIGCAAMGQVLDITGVWTSNGWAQLADNAGWVYGRQIETDLRPDSRAYAEAGSLGVVEASPVETYTYLDSYLPDYGYQTYWYGGVPLIVYNSGVWRSFYPSWRNARRHHDRDRHRDLKQARTTPRNMDDSAIRGSSNFAQNQRIRRERNTANLGLNRSLGQRQNMRTRTERNVSDAGRLNRTLRQNAIIQNNLGRERTINRPDLSNLSSPSSRRFNANNFRSRNTNTPRPTQNLYRPNTLGMGSPGQRQFSGSRLRGGFNAPAGTGSRGFQSAPSNRGGAGSNVTPRVGSFRSSPGISSGGARIGGGSFGGRSNIAGGRRR